MQATERSRQYADRYKGRNKRRRPGIFQETPSYESGRKHCKESIQYHGGDFRDIHGLSDSDSSGTDDYTDTYPAAQTRPGWTGGREGMFTLYYWKRVLTSSISQKMLWTPLKNSLLISVCTAAFGITLGSLLAWLMVRSDLPYKKFFSPGPHHSLYDTILVQVHGMADHIQE